MTYRKPVRSLFMMHVGSNAGYAIAPLETLFFQVGVELAEGDTSGVHFSYQDLESGHPSTLPADFGNIIPFDFSGAGMYSSRRLEAYVAQQRIKLLLAFDLQPVHPLIRRLRRAGVRRIISYWGAPISTRMPAWKLALKRLEIKASRSRLDSLIFESHAMADLAVQGRGWPKSRIDVVPLGVSTARFTPGSSDYVYQALGMPRGRKVIVYAGHMERRKGVHSLIKAAVELLHHRKRTDVSFLICGDKNREKDAFLPIFDGLGLESLIRFAGYRTDLERVFPSCFAGVIPSTGWDSFPRTPLEMSASGIPVIASRLQGLPEAVYDGETGLLYQPGDVQELADAIEILLNRPDLAAEYGRNARRRCEKELHVDTQRRRLLEVLRRRLSE